MTDGGDRKKKGCGDFHESYIPVGEMEGKAEVGRGQPRT